MHNSVVKSIKLIKIEHIIRELRHNNLTNSELIEIERFLKGSSYEIVSRIDKYRYDFNVNFIDELKKIYKNNNKQESPNMAINEYSITANNSVLPCKKPPEDDIERMALKTICSECTNFLKKDFGSDTCKNPHDGKIDHITGEATTALWRLNPSGYGCPNFNPIPSPKKINTIKAAIQEDKPWYILTIFSIFGALNIPYWAYKLLSFIN